jgi:hypothetical protein
VLQSDAFQKGEVFTDFIQTHFPAWKPGCKDENLARIAYLVDELNANRRQQSIVSSAHDIPSPFFTLGNWRLT